MEVAVRICPDEIVAPDVQWNPVESFRRTEAFFDYIKGTRLRDEFKYMAVVWANNPLDFHLWYKKYLELKPDVIGIGKWLSTKYNGRRADVVRNLLTNNIWDDSLEHHMLGLAYPGELLELAGLVRSCDSSSPIAHALNNIQYSYGSSHRELCEGSLGRVLDFHGNLSQYELNLAKHNINILLNYARASE